MYRYYKAYKIYWARSGKAGSKQMDDCMQIF